MVVDDDPDILFLIKKTLSRYEFHVEAFSNPVEALHEFERSNITQMPGYDLIISDIRMPGMSGIELGSKIKIINPSTKVILMTAFETTEIEKSNDVPILKYDELLKKPFALEQICEAVQKQLGS